MLNELRKYFESAQANPNSVVFLVEELLAEAVKTRASDIHFDPVSDGVIVKYRIDGVLNTIEKLPPNISNNAITRLKVMGGLLTYRNDIPQEGRIEVKANAQDGLIDQRISTFPTIYGQRAVVRLFYNNNELAGLEMLGFPESILGKLKDTSVQNQGVVLVTGPAGSGKSTTLACVIRNILQESPGKSIVTIEDPVEIRIDGVTQVQIEPFGQMTYSKALRSLLRQDPQVIMIGEIRDSETAGIVIEAGLTGHLLMSTMHSGSCSGTILRLLEMGIEPYQITSSISAIINQRLVRKLCDNCKIKDDDDSYKQKGCPQCYGTGFKGRALIAEYVSIDGDLRKAVLDRADTEKINVILESRGHRTIENHGMDLVSKGITTIEELKKVCNLQ